MAFQTGNGITQTPQPYTPDSFAGDYGWKDTDIINYFGSGNKNFQGDLQGYMKGSGKTNQDLLDMVNYYSPGGGGTLEAINKYTGLGNPAGGGGGLFGGGFDIPNLSSMRSQSASSSGSSSSGHSGINWDNPFVKEIMPGLTASTMGLQDIADNLGGIVQSKYSNLMREGLGPDAFQGTLNQMGQRNMLNSSVTGDALSKAAAEIMKEIGNKGYDSMLATEAARMEVPKIQAGIVSSLGQETDQQSSGGSSSSSVTQDPYEPDRIGAQILLAG